MDDIENYIRLLEGRYCEVTMENFRLANLLPDDLGSSFCDAILDSNVELWNNPNRKEYLEKLTEAIRMQGKIKKKMRSHYSGPPPQDASS